MTAGGEERLMVPGNLGMEAKVLASLWNRNRTACLISDRSNYQPLFRRLRSFIPRYRQLLLLGDAPKEIRHLQGAKVLEMSDLGAHKAAIEQSFAEEATGAPPIQIVAFDPDKKLFDGLLSSLDRGWTVFLNGISKRHLEALGYEIHGEIPLPEGQIVLLDPLPSDLSPEEELLLETDPCSPAVKDFMIQMRQSQVFLAFQAIAAELESGRLVSRPYLSETLRVKEKTLRKILEVGLRERRVDFRPYIQDTPEPIIEFLKNLNRGSDVALAVVFEDDHLLGYARYQECYFPSRNFLAFSLQAGRVEGTAGDPGRPWFLEMNAGDKTVHLFRRRYLYGFLLNSGSETAFFRYRTADGIENLEKKLS